MTPFRFEHEFRAADPATVFATYFHPDHLVDQDRMVEISHREVLKVEDTATRLVRTSKVQPARQLPGFIRPFVSGDLSFHETITWHRGEDRIEYDIQPSILGGRSRIYAEYKLVQAGPGRVHRSYAGHTSVEVRLVGGRIEKYIIEDLARSLPTAAACTQGWLDRAAASAAAR